MRFLNKRITLQELQNKSGIPMHRLRRLFYPDNNVKLHKPELRKIAKAFEEYGIKVTAEELSTKWDESENPYLRSYAGKRAIKKSFAIASRVLAKWKKAAALSLRLPAECSRSPSSSGCSLQF